MEEIGPNNGEASSSESIQMVSIRQKLQEVVFRKMSDVEFYFEHESGDVRIPAIKSILSTSSPVFNAMFNGDLKEKGDVKITDASSDTFDEFLQFFYGQKMELTMQNIGDILNLANKYDVAELLSICVEFLKKNLKMDNILLGLHWAIKFHLNDLKLFCESEIQKNIAEVLKMFDFGTNGEIKLTPNLDIDLDRVFPYVFSISKNILVNQSAENEKRRENVHQIVLSDSGSNQFNVSKKESIKFSVDGHMLLTDIFISKFSMVIDRPQIDFMMSITEEDPQKNSNLLFLEDIQILRSNAHYTDIHHVKLLSPIKIQPSHMYEIMIKLKYFENRERTSKAFIPYKPVKLTKNLNIWFPCINGELYEHSFIHRLHFKEICEN